MLRLISILLILFIPQISWAKLKCPSKKVQAKYDMMIISSAKKYNVEPALVHAVIKQESCYNKLAVSHAGAEGLMQLIPATAKRFNVKNSFIPQQNIDAGTKYLSWLLKRFNGNIRYALAGYNAGEGRVDQYKGIPPFKETRNYVKVVMGNYREFKGLSRFPSKNKKPQNSGLNGALFAKNKSLPTGLHVSYPKKVKINKKIAKRLNANKSRLIVRKEKTAIGSRHRIRSITLAKLDVPREGYHRIRARSKRVLQ